MRRTNPATFYGPRTYVTDFDYDIVRFKHDKKLYKRIVERRLKITLLTKDVVVCAASHMANKFAFGIFEENPILLEEKMILPALRRDKEHIVSYIKEMRVKSPLKERMERFYRDHVSEVVDWLLMENTTWFRESLLKALKNEHSVVRRSLTGLSQSKLNDLISAMEKIAVMSRDHIRKRTLAWLPRERKTLLDFANLVYLRSGARVVNCESTIPQVSYVDYSLADFSKRKSVLSDTQVFHKIFFELAFEKLNRNAIPIELIDNLSFEDINLLRKPLKNSDFRRKYDELIQSSVKIIGNQGSTMDEYVPDVEQSLKTLEQVSKTFESVFTQELPEFLKRKGGQTKATRGLQKNTLSVGLGVTGLLVPLASPITTPISLSLGGRDFFVNLIQYFNKRRDLKDHDSYMRFKAKMIREMIERYKISEKFTLLDTIDLLTSTIAAKITL